MATLEQLESAGQLVRHVAQLEHWELPSRMISYTPTFSEWFEALESVPAKRGRNISPFEQVGQIFYDFVMGRPMAYSVDYRKLEPHGQHVWEFKTPDMRVFGWFARKAHFVAVCGESKDSLTSAKAYKPYISQCFDFREALDLDPPKAILGVGRDAVL